MKARQPMLKPPIARMGGKSKLRTEIIERLTEHQCYIEVFFGAGWVYFGKEPSKTEVINDIEGELVNLFRMIKYHTEEVQRLLDFEISSREAFDRYKNVDPDDLTEIQRAIRFLYLNSQSFAAKGGNYGYKTKGKPNGRIYAKDVLNIIKERLRNTFVENLSFETLIQKYDRPYSLFFCDPPYYETGGYENPFTKEDHLKLRDALEKIQGKFILTINDHPEVRKWYKNYNIEETQVKYSLARDINARGERKELIITNY